MTEALRELKVLCRFIHEPQEYFGEAASVLKLSEVVPAITDNQKMERKQEQEREETDMPCLVMYRGELSQHIEEMETLLTRLVKYGSVNSKVVLVVKLIEETKKLMREQILIYQVQSWSKNVEWLKQNISNRSKLLERIQMLQVQMDQLIANNTNRSKLIPLYTMLKERRQLPSQTQLHHAIVHSDLLILHLQCNDKSMDISFEELIKKVDALYEIKEKPDRDQNHQLQCPVYNDAQVVLSRRRLGKQEMLFFFVFLLYKQQQQNDSNHLFKTSKHFIGSGVMGSVYEAELSDSKQTVAVKVLDSVTAKTKGQLNREAKLLWFLNGHPNCIHFHGLFNSNEEEFGLVFELCEGGSLESLLYERDVQSSTKVIIQPKQISQEQQISIIDQFVSAMLYLHEKGVVHRDIKSSNIMFVKSKHSNVAVLKLLDFGSARYATVSKSLKSTLPGGTSGTVGYSAPELFNQNSQVQTRRDSKVDVWSIGIILAEVFLQKPPYSGMIPEQIYAAMKEKQPPYKMVEIKNESLRNLVQICCSFEAAQRPSIPDIGYKLWPALRKMLLEPSNQV